MVVYAGLAPRFAALGTALHPATANPTVTLDGECSGLMQRLVR